MIRIIYGVAVLLTVQAAIGDGVAKVETGAAVARPVVARPSAFPTRGVVLTPADLTLADWPERAVKAGLTTVALHLAPSTVEKCVDSPEGQAFLKNCARLGLNVEYELHAVGELLPRNLFAREPECFRMDDKGARNPDVNLCVHSSRALEIAAANAVRIAQKLKPTTSRYYYWGDDGAGWCQCPKCRDYTDSEQALILENYLLGELRKIDPKATLSHIAYARTIPAPKKVKPAPGIFLEFAPIGRKYTTPFSQQTELRFNDTLKSLEENLKVFPVDTAQVLEYWLDVSLFSTWKRPARKLPWRPDVMRADVQSYAKLGIRSVTTFAVYIDADYIKMYGEPAAIQEYGDILRSTPPAAGRTYSVKRVAAGTVLLDGKLDDTAWKLAVAESRLAFPWEKTPAPATVFRAVRDEESLCFSFDVHDDTPVVEKVSPSKMTVEKGDRVEMFFAPDDTLSKYYCIEIDPLGRVLDYAVSYHRNFDYSWSFPKGLEVVSVRTPSGYAVEGRIPLAALESLGMPSLRKGGSMKIAILRADFRRGPDGKVEEHWISWVDPQVELPDFHVPSAFGEFR